MTYPLVLDLAGDGIPVTVICRVLGFSTQGFYKWRANPVSSRDWEDAHLINAIIDIHLDEPEFGYRFIADELHAAGHACSENRVQRLCALQKIASSILRKRRGSGKTPGPPVHDDHVGRVFHAEKLDQIWLTATFAATTSAVTAVTAPARCADPRSGVGTRSTPTPLSHRRVGGSRGGEAARLAGRTSPGPQARGTATMPNQGRGGSRTRGEQVTLATPVLGAEIILLRRPRLSGA
jgi:hypothetical protein